MKIIRFPNSIVAYNEETGRHEERSLPYYGRKGMLKGTFYPSTLIKIWTEAEVDAEIASIDAEDMRREQERIAEEKRKAEWEAYLNSLPEKIGGLRRGCCGRAYEVEDEWGNFVTFIPRKAMEEGWSLEKLTQHLQSCLDDME